MYGVWQSIIKLRGINYKLINVLATEGRKTRLISIKGTTLVMPYY